MPRDRNFYYDENFKPEIRHAVEGDESVLICESRSNTALTAFQVDLNSKNWKSHKELLDKQGLTFVLRGNRMVGSRCKSIFKKLAAVRLVDSEVRTFALAVDPDSLNLESLSCLLSTVLMSADRKHEMSWRASNGSDAVATEHGRNNRRFAILQSEHDSADKLYEPAVKLLGEFDKELFSVFEYRILPSPDIFFNCRCFRDLSRGFEVLACGEFFDEHGTKHVTVRSGSHVLITDRMDSEPVRTLYGKLFARGSLIPVDISEFRFNADSCVSDNDRALIKLNKDGGALHAGCCDEEPRGTEDGALSEAGSIKPGLYRLLEDTVFDHADTAAKFIAGSDHAPYPGWTRYGSGDCFFSNPEKRKSYGGVLFVHKFHNQVIIQICAGSSIAGDSERTEQGRRFIRQLLRQRRLAEKGEYYELKEDILLHGCAQAASFIYGSRSNGKSLWKQGVWQVGYM